MRLASRAAITPSPQVPASKSHLGKPYSPAVQFRGIGPLAAGRHAVKGLGMYRINCASMEIRPLLKSFAFYVTAGQEPTAGWPLQVCGWVMFGLVAVRLCLD